MRNGNTGLSEGQAPNRLERRLMSDLSLIARKQMWARARDRQLPSQWYDATRNKLVSL